MKPWDPAKIRVVGMVIDQTSGQILNAAQKQLIGGKVNLVFNLDMSSDASLKATDVIYVSGSFNDYIEPGTDGSVALRDYDGDKVYSAVIDVDPNQTILYKYYKNSGYTGVEPNIDKHSVVIGASDASVSDVWGTSSIESTQLQSVGIYPNPFNGFITLSNLENVSNIRITNILGQEVLSVIPSDNILNIPTTKLEKGVYFITLTDLSDMKRTERIVKQ